MVIKMNLNDATFTLKDVIKIVTFCVLGTVAWVTLKGSVSSIADNVVEIRETQIENTKKNELRWKEQEVRLNQIEINQRLFDQRLQLLEARK